MAKLPKGCQEVKVENIEIVNVREPRPGLNKNIWGVDVSYKYKCPSCGKLDNSQKSEWFFEPQHKIYSSDTCNNSSCKKSYKTELTLKCDFSELKKSKEVKKESSTTEVEENEPEEEYTSSAKEEYASNDDITEFNKKHKFIAISVYPLQNRKGNILFSFASIIALIVQHFNNELKNEAALPVTILFVVLAIFRNYKPFKESNENVLKFILNESRDAVLDMFHIITGK